RIEVQVFGGQPAHLEVRLAVGTDFADIFEIKDRVPERTIRRQHATDGSRLAFRYRNRDYEARTVVLVQPPAARVDGDELVWPVDLARDGRWQGDLEIPLERNPRELGP